MISQRKSIKTYLCHCMYLIKTKEKMDHNFGVSLEDTLAVGAACHIHVALCFQREILFRLTCIRA